MKFTRLRFLLSLLLLGYTGSAAELSIPSQTATPGQLIATTITLATEGDQISGLQFDLEWDAGLEVEVAVGRGLGGSGKLLYPAQQNARSVRLLFAGLNQGILPDGELMRVFIAVGPEAGSFQLKLTNLVGTSPGGDPVAIGASATTILVNAGVSGIPILPETVLNAASLLPGPVAPGEIVTLLGGFGISSDSSAGVAATVNGAAATVLYALGNQINTVVPFGLDLSIPAEWEVRSQDRQIARVAVPAAAASPALFTASGTGIGPGAILNEDYSLNSPANPAPPGSIVMMYGTGFGPLIPPADDGQPGIVSATATEVSARIDGLAADVLYSGAAPGLPGGVVQINIRIPFGVKSNPAAAIWLKVGSFEIPPGVSVAVR